MRESVPIPSRTCSTSAPTASHTLATALIKEIFIARKALEACLISSALLALVRIRRAWNSPVTGPGMASGFLIAAVHQRLISLGHCCGATLAVCAYHNPVRIEEVGHGCALTQ